MKEKQNVAIKVRLARAGDETILADLNRQFNSVKISKSEVLKAIKSKSTELIFVAEFDESVVGFACVQVVSSFTGRRKSAELTDIYVEECSRRKGIGSMLLLMLRKHCEKQDVGELFLRVNRSNDEAIKFYERHGFHDAEHREFRIRYG